MKEGPCGWSVVGEGKADKIRADQVGLCEERHGFWNLLKVRWKVTGRF